MARNEGSANIFNSFKMLRGNTRTSVMLEPLYGIPFVLYNFYLSLYMKSLGVSDAQIGFLIALNAVFSALFSFLGGVVTDHLGRKKTTLIFDFISLPLSLFLYAISGSFWLFAAGMFLNSFNRIVGISWNLMVIEDADNDQRVSAFNLLNIINLAMGVITPVAGIAVSSFGVISAERGFLFIAAGCMVVLILVRNHLYTETKIGQEILNEKHKFTVREIFKGGLYGRALHAIFKSRQTLIILSVFVLFSIYLPIGTFSSLYYAPYLNEVLGIGKSAVSILGGVNSVVMLFVFVLIIPVISRRNLVSNMILGIVLQAASLLWFIALPMHDLKQTVVCVALFALGFSLFRPFIDAAVAEVTDGRERAGIYSLLNTVISIAGALIGVFSGYLYQFNPRLIYLISVGILLVCAALLIAFYQSTRASGAAEIKQE